MTNYILCGFKNSGKTSVGKLLAQKLNYQFIDVDEMICDEYSRDTNTKLSIREIFKQIGEEKFRAFEKRVINTLADSKNSVIATGGGGVIDPENAATLKKIGRMIYLNVAKEVLKERMFGAALPAFIGQDNPEMVFEKIYAARAPIYRQVADIEINATGKSVEEIMIEIMKNL